MRALPCALLALLCLTFFAARGDASDPRARAKARHFFFKGAIKEAEGKEDEAYEFYKKAYQADSTYEDGAFAYGYRRFFFTGDTLDSRAEKLRALAMARPLVDLYPADTYNALSYAYLAMMADSATEALRVYNNLERVKPTESSIQIHKANAFGALNLPDSAISAIRRYERMEGMSLESALQKIKYHLLSDDTIASINEMSALVAEYPDNAGFMMAKGKVFQLFGMPDSALYCLRLAETIDPEDGRVKSELASVYAEMGDSVAYDNFIYEALLADNLDLDVKIGMLENYLRSILSEGGDTKRSDILFEKLSIQYPHEPKILFLESRYSASKKLYDQAIEQVSYAMDLDNQSPEYFSALLSFYVAADRPREAVEAYEARLASKPEGLEDPYLTEETLLLYIQANERLKQYDKALHGYDKLIKDLAPELSVYDSNVNLKVLKNLDFYSLYKLSSLYEMAGDLHFMADSLPQATANYENAIAIFPDNELALNNYAYFLVEKVGVEPGSPEFEKALEMSRKSIKLTEDMPNPTYLDTYAWILFKNSDFQEAEKYQCMAIELAGKLDYDSEEFHDHMGDILFMNGKHEEAIEEWKKALELSPDDENLTKKVESGLINP